MSCKLFSHRGLLSRNVKENTIKSFQNAFDNHFEAMEIDIWYYKKEFILSHDKPKDLNNCDNLANLFKQFGNKIDYWLDFKNLNLDNIKEASYNLKINADKFNIDYNKIIFVPYLNNINLEKNLFSYKEIRNNFGENCNIGTLIKKIDKKDWKKYHQQLKENNIKILSVQFENINEDFIKIFSDINLFAWTVNDKKDFNYLKKLKIQNIATDTLKP